MLVGWLVVGTLEPDLTKRSCITLACPMIAQFAACLVDKHYS
jgi:hypothetical protein